jgi:G3E family GTPase
MHALGLLAALDAAMAEDWQRVHGIVQRDERDLMACWIHAALHKIEGDDRTSPEGAGPREALVPSATGDAAKPHNSRYWYARTDHEFGEFPDSREELVAIRLRLLVDSPEMPG